MKKAIIGAVIIILLGGGLAAALAVRKNRDSGVIPSKSSSTSQTTTDTTAKDSTNTSTSLGCPNNSAPEPKDKEIVYNGTSFSPATLTVSKGDEVTITNASDCSLQFDSDPHPVHTDDPELNVEAISAGSSKSFMVDTTGTHGYHNHQDSSQTGTIVVK